jgi:hypothetical protein
MQCFLEVDDCAACRKLMEHLAKSQNEPASVDGFDPRAAVADGIRTPSTSTKCCLNPPFGDWRSETG